MEKKYTISQFMQLFDDAVEKATSQLDKKMREEHKRNDKEIGMGMIAFSIQNIMAYGFLRQILFNEKED